jgi:hypothetical protein
VRISLPLLALVVSSAQAQARPAALYFQFAGEGLGLSANLDVGLTQSLRLRGGAGWLWTMGTVPFSLSYLVSRKNSTLEVGGGGTLMYFLPDNHQNDGSINDYLERTFLLTGRSPMVVPVAVLGWRYHPPEGALIRLTLTPLMIKGKPHIYGGASLGFTF